MSSFEPRPESAARRDFVGAQAPWLARDAAAAASCVDELLEAAPEPCPPAPDPLLLARATRALEAAAEALRNPPPGYLSLHRNCAVELALCIARALLARELRSNPDALAACVERALASVAPERPLRLRLASPDFAALSHGLAEQLEQVRASGDLAVVEDVSLDPGDFALDGGGVDLEARMPEILERVAEALASDLAAESA